MKVSLFAACDVLACTFVCLLTKFFSGEILLVFNFQAAVGIMNPSDMNSLHGQSSMDTSDQEQGPVSQDALDGLDGKRLFSL